MRPLREGNPTVRISADRGRDQTSEGPQRRSGATAARRPETRSPVAPTWNHNHSRAARLPERRDAHHIGDAGPERGPDVHGQRLIVVQAANLERASVHLDAQMTDARGAILDAETPLELVNPGEDGQCLTGAYVDGVRVVRMGGAAIRADYPQVVGKSLRKK